MNTPTNLTAYHHLPGTGERIWITGDVLLLKAAAEQTAGAFTLLEVDSPPDSGPPPHIHERENEALYVLTGAFEFLVGDRTLRAGPGTYAFVPHSTIHRVRNVGSTPGRPLIQFTPGGIEGFFPRSRHPRHPQRPRAPARRRRDRPHRSRRPPRYGLRVVSWTPPVDQAA